MSRICLVCQAFRREGNNPVQNADLVVALAAFTKPPSDLQLEVLGKLGLVVVQISV